MSAIVFARVDRWARRGAWAAVAVALAVPVAVAVADRTWGAEVWLIAPHEPAAVALNRSLWSPGDPVADVYGSPMSAPTRVLLVPGQRVIHPAEQPTLALLPVTVAAGSRPLQVRTLWWAVRLLEAGCGAATVALFGLARLARRRERLASAARTH